VIVLAAGTATLLSRRITTAILRPPHVLLLSSRSRSTAASTDGAHDAGL
jgi:hypothetical protein